MASKTATKTRGLKHDGPSHYIVAPEAYPYCRLCHAQAAAPDLLEALREMVDTFTTGTAAQHSVRIKALDAIKKAEPQ